MSGDGDNIDFKPFLDMMIGILFILLILVGSQMFFQRFDGNPAEDPRRAAEARRLAWDAEVRTLLERIATRLTSEGKLAASADPDNRRITVDLGALMGTPAGNANTDKARTVGRVLVEELSCVWSSGPQCPSYKLVKVGYLKPSFRVAAPTGFLSTLEPAAKARFVATSVTSEILKQTPAILGIRSSLPRQVLEREESEVADVPGTAPASSITGAFVLDFVLE